MNDSVKTPPRPMGSDMSMDDILLSIRKIIATEENSKDIPPVPQQHRHQTDIQNEAIMSHRSLSNRDELNQVSNLSFEADKRIPPQNQQFIQRPDSRVQQQSYVNHAPIQESPSSERQNVNDTSEILRTLEDIKRSLSPEAIRDAKNMSEIQQPTYPEKQLPNTINELRKVTINNDQDLVDLRPAQFNAGEIPDFLKKFKKESNPYPHTLNEATQAQGTAPIYDFSQLSSFDEDDSVMELTKVVLPEAQEKISSSEQIPQEFTALDNITHNDDGFSDAMEMLMIKSLRPMLQEWIDEHLTDVAEKIIREELLKKRYKK